MEDEPSLAALLAATARGDRRAFRLVYDRESTRLFGIATSILRDRAAAADAMQTAFLRVWERSGQYQPAKGEARAWLASIVRYAALDAVRARGREIPSDNPALGDQPVEAEALDRLAALQDGARLQACMATLDPRTARFLVLAFVHGLSHAQIADKLALPLGSIKSWIRRGLLSLRECLS